MLVHSSRHDAYSHQAKDSPSSSKTAPRFLKPAVFFTFLPLKKLLPLKIAFKCQSVLFG